MYLLYAPACCLVPPFCVCTEVESHPFDIDTMLFMDWRDDHLADLPEVKARNSKLPTFLYAMPFTKNKVGFLNAACQGSAWCQQQQAMRHSSIGLHYLNHVGRLAWFDSCQAFVLVIGPGECSG
jgi:hypothetical protein